MGRAHRVHGGQYRFSLLDGNASERGTRFAERLLSAVATPVASMGGPPEAD